MRGRPDDPDLWGDLYERVRGGGEGRRGRRVPGAGFLSGLTGSLSEDNSGRLIDAAIGILGSIRTFVDVAEDVLEERRSRLGDAPARPADPWVRAPERPARPQPARHDDVVRDIPMSGA